MAQFDGATVAPIYGFRSASQYYREASAAPYVHRIRVPALFLAAANDPICPAEIYREDDFTAEPEAPVLLAVTSEGGHSMVWPSGGLFGSGAWGLEVAAEFVLAACQEGR